MSIGFIPKSLKKLVLSIFNGWLMNGNMLLISGFIKRPRVRIKLPRILVFILTPSYFSSSLRVLSISENQRLSLETKYLPFECSRESKVIAFIWAYATCLTSLIGS